MKKIVVFLLFLMVFGALSAWDEFNQYSIADELKKPGVKLVAVDFYATWCEPCNAAIPKWKKLQEKYGDKGFKLIVVSVQSEGSCSQPPQWNPDKIVCDYDGDIADAWHANDLPQAFLWSWQGNLLVAHGGVDNVAAAIEKYFKKIPRVYVEESADKDLYKMVRSELIKNSKIEVVASDEERKALAELRKKSSNMNYDTKLQCKLGEEISANSRLVISKQKRSKRDALVLELFSVEKGCLTASGTATMRGNIDTEVAEAVYNLLKNLLGTVSMPGEGGVAAKPKQQAIKFSSQTSRFGGKNDDWEIGGGKETIVKFESNPSGAVVLADGKLLCQSTPCSKMLTTGNHEIEMQMEGNCFYDISKQITVKDEETSQRFNFDSRESAVKVYVQDEKGNDLSADVFVDDKKVGKAPGTFKVPLCSKKLVVKNSSYEYSKELSLKERSVLTIQATLKNKAKNSKTTKIGNLHWSNKAPLEMNWFDAVNYCKNLTDDDHNDWRLPNIDDLRTLIQNHPGTQTDGTCPISEKAGKLAWGDRTSDCNGRDGGNSSKLGDTNWFWSSSTLSSDADLAWRVYFKNGRVGNDSKSYSGYLRCVRNAD